MKTVSHAAKSEKKCIRSLPGEEKKEETYQKHYNHIWVNAGTKVKLLEKIK